MADLALLPIYFWQITAFIYGLVIGSFLNVYIYRFHTGRSLQGSSHCLSCGKNLRWYELIPLFSYLALRGRCNGCHAYIPSRYWLVELLTAVLFCLTVGAFSNLFLILFSLAVMSVIVVITVYDIAHMVIPDQFVVTMLLLAILQKVYFYVSGSSIENIIYSVLAAMSASAFFYAMWRYSAGKWLGFGDVKLVFPLALLVGYKAVFSMVVLSFWAGAGISLVYIGWQYLEKRGKPHLRFARENITIKSEVPFAPFLIVGFLLTYLWHIDVLMLMQYAL